MSCIPCRRDSAQREKVEQLAELIKTQAHTLMPEMAEAEFYKSGLLRSAVEYLRGQYSATMADKKAFAALVLNHLQDRALIRSWSPAGGQNRYDYEVVLASGRIAAIELKGCLDGNNTNIFERPHQAEEFVIWSVCTNPNADPERNVWSGLHTRLSAEIIVREVCVDAVIVWDMLCDTLARPCPKLLTASREKVEVGQYALVPPCVYLLPRTVPSPRNNPAPPPHTLANLEFARTLNVAFGGLESEVRVVTIEARQNHAEIERRTTVLVGGTQVRQSGWTPIRRR